MPPNAAGSHTVVAWSGIVLEPGETSRDVWVSRTREILPAPDGA
jgi:hypothetical protein